ncbi:MAG: Mur ligase family protein, partial [Pseudomonadota bacterium]
MKKIIQNATGIAVDSRLVKPGYIFVAIKGIIQDGHKYIDQAIGNGASVIIYQDDGFSHVERTYRKFIKVKDTRAALSEIASMFYLNQPKFILGITGTSGKSSIVHFVREIIRLLKKPAVSIGTLGVLGDFERHLDLTTPATIDLHEILNDIYKKNIDYVGLECSSHGIDQHRLDNIKFFACGFSNLSRDHLDYHKDLEEYFAVKTQLFKIMKDGCAVLNTDIPQFDKLYKLCKSQGHKIITYGKKEADIKIKSIRKNSFRQIVTWEIKTNIYNSEVDLIGEFQVYNLACAIGLIMSTGINL